MLPPELNYFGGNMNATLVLQDLLPRMSLFEIAGRIDMSFSTHSNHSSIPFINMLKTKQNDTDTALKADPARKPVPARKRPAKLDETPSTPADNKLITTRHAEFVLQAPQARNVKLAADFTGWEKSPVAMTKNEKGVWRAQVPLSPGTYSYRFIVDGNWYDDPQSSQSVPNPYGTLNAVKLVA
jgi:hypothetical protein